jgi:hypothetical protein
LNVAIHADPEHTLFEASQSLVETLMTGGGCVVTLSDQLGAQGRGARNDETVTAEHTTVAGLHDVFWSMGGRDECGIF